MHAPCLPPPPPGPSPALVPWGFPSGCCLTPPAPWTFHLLRSFHFQKLPGLGHSRAFPRSGSPEPPRLPIPPDLAAASLFLSAQAHPNPQRIPVPPQLPQTDRAHSSHFTAGWQGGRQEGEQTAEQSGLHTAANQPSSRLVSGQKRLSHPRLYSISSPTHSK